MHDSARRVWQGEKNHEDDIKSQIQPTFSPRSTGYNYCHSTGCKTARVAKSMQDSSTAMRIGESLLFLLTLRSALANHEQPDPTVLWAAITPNASNASNGSVANTSNSSVSNTSGASVTSSSIGASETSGGTSVTNGGTWKDLLKGASVVLIANNPDCARFPPRLDPGALVIRFNHCENQMLYNGRTDILFLRTHAKNEYPWGVTKWGSVLCSRQSSTRVVHFEKSRLVPGGEAYEPKDHSMPPVSCSSTRICSTGMHVLLEILSTNVTSSITLVGFTSHRQDDWKSRFHDFSNENRLLYALKASQTVRKIGCLADSRAPDESDALRALMDSVRMTLPAARYLVVAFVTNELLAFAKNWLCSLHHLPRRAGVLIVGLDAGVCAQLHPWLEQRGARCTDRQIAGGAPVNSVVRYASGKYKAALRRRLEIFANLSSFETYSRVLLLDVDIVLHDDPFPALLRRAEPLTFAREHCSADALVNSSDEEPISACQVANPGPAGKDCMLNGGVVAVRPGTEALALMHEGLDALANGNCWDDQCAMQTVAERHRGAIGLLPCGLFVPGNHLPRLEFVGSRLAVKGGAAIVGFHMNKLFDSAEKHNCLSVTGQWLERPPPVLCARGGGSGDDAPNATVRILKPGYMICQAGGPAVRDAPRVPKK